MYKDQIASVRLVEGLKAGESVAFREIFLLFEKRLYHFVFSITKSEYISEEITQEVFIKVWERRKTIDAGQSFDAFIFTIARNLTYNFLRDASRRKSIRDELWKNISIEQSRVESVMIFDEYRGILEDIIQRLPQQKKSIYVLSREQGKSNTEIAELLGISEKTVRNHLWKTMTIIRNQLQPYLDDTLKVLVLIYLLF